MGKVDFEYIRCPRLDCIHNKAIEGREGVFCETLRTMCSAGSQECPFHKTRTQDLLEQGALLGKDWDGYRLHSETKPVTIVDVVEWIDKFERVCPSTDNDVKAKMAKLRAYVRGSISVPKALDRLAAYFEKHPEGKAWGMSAVETAEMILLTEDDYDEVESDETVSDELLSE